MQLELMYPKSLRALAVMAALAVPAVAFADDQEDVVKMTERQADAIKAAAPDCDKIGDALLKNADKDAALMKKVVEADRKKTPEQKKTERTEFTKKYSDRLKAAQAKMAPLKDCRDNAKVKEWKNKIDEATAPPK